MAATTDTTTSTVSVDLGGWTVSVPAGGLFDRYRMDTPLDVVAADPRVPGVDFFRTLPKAQVDSPIGSTRTPNFYYAMSSARLTMLARSSAIHTRLPSELAPLEIVPGGGLISLIFFRYDVCDIDFYTEAAVGVAVRPARHGGPGVADLVSGLATTTCTRTCCRCRSTPRSPRCAATTATASPSGSPARRDLRVAAAGQPGAAVRTAARPGDHRGGRRAA